MAQAPQQSGFQRAFSNIFGGGNQQDGQQQGNQQQNNQQQNNQNRQQQNNQNGQQGNQGNNNNNNQQASNDPESRKSPLDAYKDLWSNVDDAADKPPEFKIDQKLIDSTAGQLDFLRNMPPELQQEMEALGETAPTVMKLLQHMGRQVYATSINHNSALTDKFLGVRSQYDQKGLGRQIKEHIVLTGIDTHKAAQSNPIVRENLRLIAQNLAKKNPDATPEWIQQQAVEYFTQMANSLNPQANAQEQEKQAQKQPGGQDFDWGTWLEEGKGTQQ